MKSGKIMERGTGSAAAKVRSSVHAVSQSGEYRILLRWFATVATARKQCCYSRLGWLEIWETWLSEAKHADSCCETFLTCCICVRRELVLPNEAAWRAKGG